MIRLSRELNLLQHVYISETSSFDWEPCYFKTYLQSSHWDKKWPVLVLFYYYLCSVYSYRYIKMDYLIFLTFVLFLKIIFSRWSIWTNFLGNISLLGNLKNPKPYSSTSIRSTTTTLGWVVTKVEGLSLMKSDVPLIMWFFGVTWQNKNVMFPIPEDVGECYLPSNMSVWLRGYIMSCDKIKTLYLLEHL